jgi:hypothetical protein
MDYRTMNNRWLCAGLGRVLGCLLFVIPFCCQAQYNLVPNPSFEQADTCWPFSGFRYPYDGPDGWFSGGHSPDYFQGPDCAAYGSNVSAPLNNAGFQYPQDGVCYVGVVTYQHPVPWREYAVVELIEPLVIGETYYASFYANAAWGGTETYPIARLACSKVGMRFTMEPNQWVWGDPLPTTVNYAQVYYPQILADTVDWTLVSGSFVADSAYRYVMVGNHFSNAQTDTLPFEPTISLPSGYTFIDNVCVTSDPNGCPLAAGIDNAGSGSMMLFPNPVNAVLRVSGVPEGARAAVYDGVGRTVWVGAAGHGLWQLNVSTWSRGTYVLRIEALGLVHSFRFVLTD